MCPRNPSRRGTCRRSIRLSRLCRAGCQANYLARADPLRLCTLPRPALVVRLDQETARFAREAVNANDLQQEPPPGGTLCYAADPSITDAEFAPQKVQRS